MMCKNALLMNNNHYNLRLGNMKNENQCTSKRSFRSLLFLIRKIKYIPTSYNGIMFRTISSNK